MTKRRFFTIAFITAAIAFIILTRTVHANKKWCDCEYKPTPTLTPKPTPTPKPTISPTLTPIPTATPSATTTTTEIQQGDGRSDGRSSNPGATEAPAPVTCTIPFSPPVIIGFQALGNGSVQFSWLEADQNISKYSIIYGYSPDALVYGEDNIPSTSTSIQINDLQVGKSVFLEVWGWKNGCSEVSNIFDPIVL